MKRVLLLLLLLSAALTFGCPPPRNENTNNDNGNSNRYAKGNSNHVGTTNGNDIEELLMTRDPRQKSILLALSAKPGAREREVVVAPKKLWLYLGGDQKLRFTVFNNLADDVEKVEINFPSGDPFDGGRDFEINNVASGTSGNSQTRKAKTVGLYSYNIKVTLKGSNLPIIVDPEVEIVGAPVE